MSLMYEDLPSARCLWRRSRRVAWIVLLSVCGGMWVEGDDQRPSVGELVPQLGASSFEQREAAEHRLQQRGIEALPVLRQAMDSGDLEIRYRARRLVTKIENARQWRLLDDVLVAYDPELAQQLPGWTRFDQLVGDDLESRQLFVEMYEADPDIMRLIDQDSASLTLALEGRSTDLRPDINRRPTESAVPAASTAVLLFASLDPAANPSPRTLALINSLVSESAFQRAASSSNDPPLRRLLAGWVSQAKDVDPATRMNLGTQFELRTAVDPAVELIKVPTRGSQLQYAVFTIARMDAVEQIPLLETLLDDSTVLSERQRGTDEAFECQVRDVALAALVHLIGKSPHEFGFTDLRTNSNYLFALNTAGFDSDEQRAIAFRRWTLWRAVQHHEGHTVAENAVAGVSL